MLSPPEVLNSVNWLSGVVEVAAVTVPLGETAWSGSAEVRVVPW